MYCILLEVFFFYYSSQKGNIQRHWEKKIIWNQHTRCQEWLFTINKIGRKKKQKVVKVLSLWCNCCGNTKHSHFLDCIVFLSSHSHQATGKYKDSVCTNDCCFLPRSRLSSVNNRAAMSQGAWDLHGQSTLSFYYRWTSTNNSRNITVYSEHAMMIHQLIDFYKKIRHLVRICPTWLSEAFLITSI